MRQRIEYVLERVLGHAEPSLVAAISQQVDLKSRGRHNQRDQTGPGRQRRWLPGGHCDGIPAVFAIPGLCGFLREAGRPNPEHKSSEGQGRPAS